MLIGYASMLVALSLVFVGIRNYRDKYNNGVISFGKAFKIGIMIVLIASTIYVVAWLIDYFFFIPDFMEKYSSMARCSWPTWNSPYWTPRTGLAWKNTWRWRVKWAPKCIACRSEERRVGKEC